MGILVLNGVNSMIVDISNGKVHERKTKYMQENYSEYLLHFIPLQNQPFADVLQNRCFYKFCNIHRKTPVLESLFNKFAGLRPATLFKRYSNTGVFL